MANAYPYLVSMIFDDDAETVAAGIIMSELPLLGNQLTDAELAMILPEDLAGHCIAQYVEALPPVTC